MPDILPDQLNAELDADFNNLRFIRVFTPDHVPRYLMDQVRHKDYDVDEWYDYQRIMCIQQTQNGPILNPMNLLYVIATKENLVVGVLWCQIDPLSKALVIQTFSMDNLYWHRGAAVRLIEAKAKEVQSECKLKRIYWITNFPKHSERYGFKRSKSVLMEYTPREEDHGQNNNGELRQSEPSDEATAAAPESVLSVRATSC
jgi:N-acetylglutamate synthase-like GNAT family acetyltransferase